MAGLSCLRNISRLMTRYTFRDQYSLKSSKLCLRQPNQEIITRTHSGLCPSFRTQCGRRLLVFQPVRLFRSVRSEGQSMKNKDVKGPFSALWRPFVYTCVVCSCSFIGAIIWSYETHKARVSSKNDFQFPPAFSSPKGKEFGVRNHANAFWNNMSKGKQLIAGIIAVNFGVFLCWKIPKPAVQQVLQNFFTCVTGKPTVSMLLSGFSHVSFAHFAINMYVMWSFSTAVIMGLGREQFAGFYLSALTVSSLTSVANKLARNIVVPSVGASGALMAILGLVAHDFPNSEVAIAFVSQIFPHSFSIKNGVIGIFLLDFAGLLLGWRFFDHACHLGGLLFGFWYAKYGRNWIHQNRNKVIKPWKKLTEGRKS